MSRALSLADRRKLFHGPYRCPNVRKGDSVFCEIRGWVKVQGFSDGPIPWPRASFKGYRGRGPLVICGDLAMAIRMESAQAVQHWWGAGSATVSKWRRQLGVAMYNEGTLKLWSLWKPLKLPEDTIAFDPAKLRARRLALGLSQAEVARRCGWRGSGSYSELENSHSHRSHRPVLERVAKSLECRVKDLLPES